MGFCIKPQSVAASAKTHGPDSPATPKTHTRHFSCRAKNAYRGLQVENPGRRLYNPGMGRWINRDPIGERGGVNLMSFVRNQATIKVDLLGLAEKDLIHGTKSCEKGECCEDLAAKATAWDAHLAERVAQLTIDLKSLKTISPIEYNNHIQKAVIALKNLIRCRAYYVLHIPPCNNFLPPLIPYKIPDMIPETGWYGKQLLKVPGSDKAWGTGAVIVGAASVATLAVLAPELLPTVGELLAPAAKAAGIVVPVML